MAMMHNSLIAYYEKVFAFKQCHGWSLTEIEDLLPCELDVMTSLLSGYLVVWQRSGRRQLFYRSISFIVAGYPDRVNCTPANTKADATTWVMLKSAPKARTETIMAKTGIR